MPALRFPVATAYVPFPASPASSFNHSSRGNTIKNEVSGFVGAAATTSAERGSVFLLRLLLKRRHLRRIPERSRRCWSKIDWCSRMGDGGPGSLNVGNERLRLSAAADGDLDDAVVSRVLQPVVAAPRWLRLLRSQLPASEASNCVGGFRQRVRRRVCFFLVAVGPPPPCPGRSPPRGRRGKRRPASRILQGIRKNPPRPPPRPPWLRALSLDSKRCRILDENPAPK